MSLGSRVRLPANVCVSNVPGPQYPMYLAGTELLEYYPISIVTDGQALNITVSLLAAATEAYRVQRARYREGATTILDLLEAQVALSEAEAALVQARYSTHLALAQIEALLGRRVFETER